MSGALSRAVSAGPRRMRGYAGGGGVDPDDPSQFPIPPMPPSMVGAGGRSMPVPPMPPPGGPSPLAQANPGDATLPSQGAVGQTMSGAGGSPDQQDPNAGQKMSDLNRAMMVLRASSGVNPMLAAAGAMLAPTHTGGFSESLGNAFTAYSRAGAEERNQDEQAAQRLLQAQWQNDYRQQMAAASTSRAATGDRLADARIPLMQVQSSMDMARAAMLQAHAAAGAASHVTPGDLQAEAMNSLLTPGTGGSLPVNPDTGNPFTKIEAYNATQAATAAGQGVAGRTAAAAAKLGQQQPVIDARVAVLQQTPDYRNQLLALKQQGLSDAEATTQLDTAIRQQQTDILQQKVNQNQPLVDAKVDAITNTQAYHDSLIQLRQEGIPFTQALAVNKTAAQILAAKPGTTWAQALAQAKEGLPGQQPAAKPATSSAPPAQGSPGPTPAVRPSGAIPPPPAGFPNAQWSAKYGTYLVPGDTSGSWKNVGTGQASP
jgi:hypothetical protein